MMARCLSSCSICVGLLGVLVLAFAGAPARADLLKYVKKPEPKFAWKLKGTRDVLGNKVYDIELTSQVWQKIPWTHDLVVVVPAKVEPTATMLLWNQGGKPSPASLAMAADLARKIKAPVAFL